MRVATPTHSPFPAVAADFNPRHPCGWRRPDANQGLRNSKISIHATHAGGDKGRYASSSARCNFNPRHPCGWRPGGDVTERVYTHISIHATHAGGDAGQTHLKHDQNYFNPRHPCGWRQSFCNIFPNKPRFQSTPPMRVATLSTVPPLSQPGISIHATHAGGDCRLAFPRLAQPHFNPRHPCGWRPLLPCIVAVLMIFQSTPPMRVATWLIVVTAEQRQNFNPRHPCGWRPVKIAGKVAYIHISIHATHAGGDVSVHLMQSRSSLFQSTPPMRVATRQDSLRAR